MSTTWVPADTFGMRLVLVRRHLGLTVEEAASRCGIPHATWTTWENGSTPRNMAKIAEKIEAALGVDRGYLMWGPGSAPPGQHTDAEVTPAHLPAIAA